MKKHKFHLKKIFTKKEEEVKPDLSQVHKFQEVLARIRQEIGKTVVGQEEIINGILRAVLSDGHVLLEGIPGIAKTLIIRTFATVTGGKFSRVQFTADLLPSDITGLTSYNKEKDEFSVVKGPIFANYVIADEVNRSPPKCVLKDTEILMSNGSLNNIENIFNNYSGKLALKEKNEEWYFTNKPLKIMSFDPRDKKIKIKKVKYLYKQITKNPYYEITLKSGRLIRTSPMHPFFSFKEGNILNIISSDLKINDCVLIPKKINLKGNNELDCNEGILKEINNDKNKILKRQKLYNEVQKLKNKDFSNVIKELNLKSKDIKLAKFYLKHKPEYLDLEFDKDSVIVIPKSPGHIQKIKMPLMITKELAHFFALLISEGNQKDYKFYLSMKDKAIVEYFVKLLHDLFGIKTKIYIDKGRGMYRVALWSKPLEKLLKAVNYKMDSLSYNKDIPDFIMKADDEIVREFLRMYYEGDGGISRDCVKVVTKSKFIANKLSYLLLRFGLVAKINHEYAKTHFSSGYSYEDYFYNLRLYGNDLNIFREKIGFFSDEKNNKLKECCLNVAFNKNDTIPFIHSKIRGIRKRNDITHKKFYDSTGMYAHNLENPNNRFGISRNALNIIYNSLNGFEELKEIVQGDFYCDYVKSINIIYPNEPYYLYDFSIDETHSFIGGFGGIILHNTQSSVLEAMQERQVTIGNTTYHLPKPFFVMATQNPIESSGVYPLPEAQLDRFLFKIRITYPKIEEEPLILKRNITLKRFEEFSLKKISNPDEIVKMQDFTKKIYLSKAIEDYIVKLIDATRNPGKYKITSGHYIEWGCSPRGSIGLYIGSKAEALIQGSNFVTPAYVRNVAYDVMRHRILLNYEGQAENIKTEDIIKEILQKVPAP